MPIFKGSTQISGAAGIPDYAKATNISFPFTVPANGLVWCWQVASNSLSQLFVNNVEIGRMYDNNDSGSCGGNSYALVAKGDIVSLGSGQVVTIAKFFPFRNIQ